MGSKKKRPVGLKQPAHLGNVGRQGFGFCSVRGNPRSLSAQALCPPTPLGGGGGTQPLPVSLLGLNYRPPLACAIEALDDRDQSLVRAILRRRAGINK